MNSNYYHSKAVMSTNGISRYLPQVLHDKILLMILVTMNVLCRLSRYYECRHIHNRKIIKILGRYWLK